MDIDKLLLQLLKNEDASKEYDTLDEWKKEAVESLKALDSLSKDSGDSISSSYKKYDKVAAWEKISNQLEPTPTPQSPKSNKWIWATLLLFLIAGTAFITYKSICSSTDKTQKIYNSDTQTMAFALEDESQIWLREGGSILSLESDFTQERRVRLEGEAFFDIAKDAERPFIIELTDSDFIKVLGTSFNVINKEDQLDVVVYSGVVEFHTLNRPLTLQKGDMATRIKGSISVVKNKDGNKISWKTNQLVFEDTPLLKVFKALENHYNISIHIDKGISSNCPIRTKFTDESIESVMKELSQLSRFEYNINHDQISVKNINCVK